MKFRLLDLDRKELHSAVMSRIKRPDVVTWGRRSFVFDKVADDKTVTYVEVDTYRIG